MSFIKILRKVTGKRIISRKRPIKSMNLESARSCNLKCIQCATHAPGFEKRFCSSNITSGTLTLETFSKVIPFLDQVESLNLDNHGEPLLNKDLEKIISLAKKSASHIRVTLTSNFIMMNRGRATSILQAGVDCIQVSVNGVKKETYEKIMKGAKYGQLLENLSTFSSVRNEISNQLTTFSACITTMRSNIDELVMLPSLLAKYAINLIRINSLLPFNSNVQSESMYDDSRFHSYREEVYRETIQEAEKYNMIVYRVLINPGGKKCGYPIHNFSVSYDGEVCPCWMLDIKGGYNF